LTIYNLENIHTEVESTVKQQSESNHLNHSLTTDTLLQPCLNELIDISLIDSSPLSKDLSFESEFEGNDTAISFKEFSNLNENYMMHMDDPFIDHDEKEIPSLNYMRDLKNESSPTGNILHLSVS
jgi:hypothetical protein